MTKPPFQNVLLLLYFMLRMMMWGERMCSAGGDEVVKEDKAKGQAAGREEERGRWSVEQFPPSSGTLLSCRADPAFGRWQREWQDEAKQSPIFGQGEVHYTPSDSPSQPSGPGTELTGPLTQAPWGVLIWARGGDCPVPLSSGSSVCSPPFISLRSLSGVHAGYLTLEPLAPRTAARTQVRPELTSLWGIAP